MNLCILNQYPNTNKIFNKLLLGSQKSVRKVSVFKIFFVAQISSYNDLKTFMHPIIQSKITSLFQQFKVQVLLRTQFRMLRNLQTLPRPIRPLQVQSDPNRTDQTNTGGTRHLNVCLNLSRVSTHTVTFRPTNLGMIVLTAAALSSCLAYYLIHAHKTALSLPLLLL